MKVRMKMSPDVYNTALAKKLLQRDEAFANSNRLVRTTTNFSSVKLRVEVTAQNGNWQIKKIQIGRKETITFGFFLLGA